MQFQDRRQINLFPLANADVGHSMGSPAKPTIILIRWPLVIICSYLLLYRSQAESPYLAIDIFVLVYVASNVVLYFVREQTFHAARFYASLVLLDTLILTLSLVINGQVEADFYLTYFFLIIICCLFENPKMIAGISILGPIIYAALLFQADNYNPSMYLRLPFLFVVALFYGYFTQLVRNQKALKEQAEQKNQARIDLLNIVSHELRTPLTIISNYAQAMRSTALGNINKEQDRALGKVLLQSDHLLNIMNIILDTASIETGSIAANRDEFLLSEFMDDIKATFDGNIGKADVALRWDDPPEKRIINSDRGKLKIILGNLIGNAVKFTETGEIRISAQYLKDKKCLEFKVVDTGIGIPEKQIPFVFDKFWQVDPCQAITHGGMGMGLYIVKAFTEVLGGTIGVESAINKGTTFVVSLPAES